MALTNFPNGVTSFGVPLVGGLGGIPLTGTWYFCDYANGSDGNDGLSPENPLKTISRAHELCTAGNNDVVVIIGDGSTTATQRLESTLTWSKNATHLIGETAPSMEGQRARISTLTTATTNINPLMTVSASGCIFANFSFFQGVGQATTDEQLINITGSRNYFGNVQFGGMGHANGAARAGSYVIQISGGGENLFEHCSIGIETIARSAANASVRLRSGAQRNNFRNCDFPMYATQTSPIFIDANATNSLNGSSTKVKDCMFLALQNVSSAAVPAAVATVAADANGTIFFSGCTALATAWAATTELVQVPEVTGTAATNGIFDGV
jgi:hypothetical protein